MKRTCFILLFLLSACHNKTSVTNPDAITTPTGVVAGSSATTASENIAPFFLGVSPSKSTYVPGDLVTCSTEKDCRDCACAINGQAVSVEGYSESLLPPSASKSIADNKEKSFSPMMVVSKCKEIKAGAKTCQQEISVERKGKRSNSIFISVLDKKEDVLVSKMACFRCQDNKTCQAFVADAGACAAPNFVTHEFCQASCAPAAAPEPLQVQVSASPPFGPAPLRTKISVGILGGKNDFDISLDFGDGTLPMEVQRTSRLTKFIVVYPDEGRFSVVATVTDANGIKAEAGQIVIVVPRGDPVNPGKCYLCNEGLCSEASDKLADGSCPADEFATREACQAEPACVPFPVVDDDQDDDGIPDDVEGRADNVDTDRDVTPDYLDTDSDNDGIPDVVEGALDSDSDGVFDFRDPDSDDDGLLDKNEGVVDTDHDGFSNYVDSDSDGDGAADGIEWLVDIGHDGVSYVLDPAVNGATLDRDQDGLVDADEIGDRDHPYNTDGDGLPDYLESDSDNDTVIDGVDAFPRDRTESVDTDSDGVGNNADTDDDNDGALDKDDHFVLDPAESIDTDLDTVGNNADTDDDNDGLLDADDSFPLVSKAIDFDADGQINDVDGDDDNDGLFDVLEIANGSNPLNDDSDGDGIKDGQIGAACTHNELCLSALCTSDHRCLSAEPLEMSRRMTTLAGPIGFTDPAASCISPDGSKLYILDSYGAGGNVSHIRQVSLADGVVSTLWANDIYAADRNPDMPLDFAACVVDPVGKTLYVTSGYGSKVITKLDLESPAQGLQIFIASDKGLDSPSGIVIDNQGKNLFISDLQTNLIQKIDIASGAISPIAGTIQDWSVPNHNDGPGALAGFISPQYLAIDPKSQYLYVGEITSPDDTASNLRRININPKSSYEVTSIRPQMDGVSPAEIVYNGLVLDPTGRFLYFTDVNNRLRRVDLQSNTLTTLAGSDEGFAGDQNACAGGVRLNNPNGVVVSPAGETIFVVDRGNLKIRQMKSADIEPQACTAAEGSFTPDGNITLDLVAKNPGPYERTHTIPLQGTVTATANCGFFFKYTFQIKEGEAWSDPYVVNTAEKSRTWNALYQTGGVHQAKLSVQCGELRAEKEIALEVKQPVDSQPPASATADPLNAVIEVQTPERVKGQPVQFKVSVAGGLPQFRYDFSVFSGDQMIVPPDPPGNSILSGDREKIWSFTPVQSGEYELRVLVVDDQGRINELGAGYQRQNVSKTSRFSVADPSVTQDTDGDAVVDIQDNCPALANVDQLNTDRDALGNVCDPDDDGDGILDAKDIAPLDATHYDAFHVQLMVLPPFPLTVDNPITFKAIIVGGVPTYKYAFEIRGVGVTGGSYRVPASDFSSENQFQLSLTQGNYDVIVYASDSSALTPDVQAQMSVCVGCEVSITSPYQNPDGTEILPYYPPDTNGDGILDADDPDIDGDGILNGEDDNPIVPFVALPPMGVTLPGQMTISLDLQNSTRLFPFLNILQGERGTFATGVTNAIGAVRYTYTARSGQDLTGPEVWSYPNTLNEPIVTVPHFNVSGWYTMKVDATDSAVPPHTASSLINFYVRPFRTTIGKTPNYDLYYPGDVITFNARDEGGASPFHYHWVIKKGTEVVRDTGDVTESFVRHTVVEAAPLSVELTITDSMLNNPQSASATASVRVEEAMGVVVPPEEERATAVAADVVVVPLILADIMESRKGELVKTFSLVPGSATGGSALTFYQRDDGVDLVASVSVQFENSSSNKDGFSIVVPSSSFSDACYHLSSGLYSGHRDENGNYFDGAHDFYTLCPTTNINLLPPYQWHDFRLLECASPASCSDIGGLTLSLNNPQCPADAHQPCSASFSKTFHLATGEIKPFYAIAVTQNGLSNVYDDRLFLNSSFGELSTGAYGQIYWYDSPSTLLCTDDSDCNEFASYDAPYCTTPGTNSCSVLRGGRILEGQTPARFFP
ncbi:MAG: hypothetical protein Q7T03_01205 [Deltaproteobacteria bacterium]|nr:hypothetical protein [Deltaproteobacteria bacterium]